MGNMTLSIPDTLLTRMKTYAEIRWSEVARKAIEQRANDLELIDDLRALEKAEKEMKDGKAIPYKVLVKRLGIENEL